MRSFIAAHMSKLNTLEVAAPSAGAKYRPEFTPLPLTGGDAVTGLSRSWWYDLERRGLITLVRLRKPGSAKARVLLPVERALAVLEKLGGPSA
jgi:hypothetical protein